MAKNECIKIEKLSDAEQRELCAIINTFGQGCHPSPRPSILNGFHKTYIQMVLRRAEKVALSSMPEKLTIVRSIRKGIK